MAGSRRTRTREVRCHEDKVWSYVARAGAGGLRSAAGFHAGAGARQRNDGGPGSCLALAGDSGRPESHVPAASPQRQRGSTEWRLAARARRQDGQRRRGSLVGNRRAVDARAVGLHLQRGRREPSRLGECEHPARRDPLLQLPDRRRCALRRLQDQGRTAREPDLGVVRLAYAGERLAAPHVRLHASRVRP